MVSSGSGGDRFLRTLLSSLCFFVAMSGGRLSAQHASPAPIPVSVSASASPDPAERQALANRYVHEILPYWQQRLQLQDWTVHLLLSRPVDLRPGTLGNIHWDMEKKTATIRVMDASGYTTDVMAMLQDMQVTVVHELVHLELASLPVSDADRSNQENAIDHLTDALLHSEP
jgi:hypothetical protein